MRNTWTPTWRPDPDVPGATHSCSEPVKSHCTYEPSVQSGGLAPAGTDNEGAAMSSSAAPPVMSALRFARILSAVEVFRLGGKGKRVAGETADSFPKRSNRSVAIAGNSRSFCATA